MRFGKDVADHQDDRWNLVLQACDEEAVRLRVAPRREGSTRSMATHCFGIHIYIGTIVYPNLLRLPNSIRSPSQNIDLDQARKECRTLRKGQDHHHWVMGCGDQFLYHFGQSLADVSQIGLDYLIEKDR